MDDQELLGEALHSLEPSVNLVSFVTGKKFIDILENTAAESLPDLIILDYNIPEINGAEILQYLRQNERYSTINKVVWSTSNSDKFKTSCLELGAVDYIVKPSSLSGMQTLAETFLRYCTENR